MKAAICFLLLFSITTQVFAQDLEKKINFLETKYVQGDFKTVILFSQRLIKKLELRQPIEYVGLIKAYGYYASSKYKMSFFEEYENKMILAKGVIKDIPKDSVKTRRLALLALAKTYQEVGLYKNAQQYIDEANGLNSKSNENFLSKFNLNLTTAAIYTNRGFNQKADSILQVINANIQALTSKVKTVISKNGTEKQVRLNKVERKFNDQNYAKFLTLRAIVEYNKGNYKTASNLSSSNILWTRKNLGKRSEFHSKNHLLLANTQLEQDLQQEAFSSYKRAFRFTKGKESHPDKIFCREKIISLYVQSEKDLKLRRNSKRLARATRYYPKSSSNKLLSKLPEVSRLMFQNRFSKANKKISSLLDNNKLKLYPFDKQTIFFTDLFATNLISLNKGFQATDSIKKAISIQKEIYGDDAPEYHQYLMKLAYCYINYTNEFKAAKSIYNNSFFNIITSNYSNEHRNYVPHLEQVGLYYDLVDKYDSSLYYYQQAVNVLKVNSNVYNIKNVPALEKLADIQLKKGEYEAANSTINNAIEILNTSKSKVNDLEKVSTFETMSRLYNTLGKYKESEQALKIAKKLSKKSKFLKDQASAKTADDQAKAYIRTGKYSSAEELLLSTIEIKQKKLGSSNRELVSSLNELGYLYILIGKYNEAEKVLNRSLDIDEKVFGNSSLKFAETLRLLEKLYVSIGDFKRAEDAASAVLTIRTKLLGTRHLETANSITELAYVKFYNNGDRSEIDLLLNQSLQTFQSIVGSDHPQYAEVLKDMAILKIESNQLKLADSLLDKASQIWDRKFGTNNVNSAEVQVLRGEIYKKYGNYIKSEELYTNANRTYKSIFNDKHPSYVNTLSKLSQVYFMEGNYNKALSQLDITTTAYLSFTQSYFKTLSGREKSKFWNVIKEDFEFYNCVAAKLYDKKPKLTTKMYDNLLQTKGLLLSNSIRLRERIQNSKNSALIEKFNDWNEKKELLTSLLTQSSEQAESNGLDAKKLEKEIEQLEKQLTEDSEEFKNSVDNKRFTWKDVKNSLKPNEYAVEIIRYRYFDKSFTDSVIYAALVLSSTSDKPQLVIIGNGKKLETKMLKYYRNTIKNRSEDKLSYKNFWSPLKPFIPLNSKVYFSAEGVYNQINLESLLNTETGKYLIDENEIVLLTSTKEIPLKRKFLNVPKNIDNNAIVIGNPMFYSQQASNPSVLSLPGAEEEVKTINDLFKNRKWNSNLYLGVKSDKELIKSLNSPKVFHIATHGYFKEDVVASNASIVNIDLVNDPLLRCGLLLKGAGDYLDNLVRNSESGILTAYEAMNLSLDNTELVVLSACETGAGEVQVGEGVFGLQRSFLVAGSELVIMSLFKVSDEATQQLMATFYKNWLESGNKRKAFSDAKHQLSQTYKNPIYWGSFIMIGMD